MSFPRQSYNGLDLSSGNCHHQRTYLSTPLVKGKQIFMVTSLLIAGICLMSLLK